MQAIMAYIGQLQASGGGAGAGASGPMGLNEYGGQGFDAGGAAMQAAPSAYSGYNTSIYGNLGAPKTESSY